MAVRIRRLSLLVVLLLLLGLLPSSPVTAQEGGARIKSGTPRIDLDAGKLALPPKPRHEKLDATLNHLVEQAGRRGAAAAAAEAPLSRDSAVAVSIRLSGAAGPVQAWLTSQQALIANVGKDVIEAYVPVGALAALGGQPGVLAVEALIPPHANVTSQGVTVHGAPNWHANGYTGAGVKVGIIDVGFIGYSSLIGSELPAPAAVRCYVYVGVYSTNLADCQTWSSHGTAVAETIIDVAPQATLYLATPLSQLDLQNSVLWMASQGVHVINMSLSWSWDGPGDGTSPYTDSPLVSAGVLQI
jgi:subtilisin family serine protease